jgi:large subunit ribosomal protein L18e
MGVERRDLVKKKRTVRSHSLSTNPYQTLLVKLYKYLSSRTKSKFNRTVLARLLKARSNCTPVSLSRLSTCMRRKTQWQDPAKTKAPIAVVVGSVLDDIRMTKVAPKLRICALRFSRSVRERIEGAGGECMTFDQLAMTAPTGKNTFLLRGKRVGREKEKKFGAAGVPGSHVKPKAPRYAEVGRGRRNGQGYKKAAFKHRQ